MSDEYIKSKARRIKDVLDNEEIEVEVKTSYEPTCLLVSFPYEPEFSPMIIPPEQINRFMMLVRG